MSSCRSEGDEEEQILSFFESNREILLKNYPGLTKRRLIQELEYLSDDLGLDRFFAQLLKGIPLGYISGKSFFFNSVFFVTPDVLIPRFETEILVEMALSEIQKMEGAGSKKIKITDVGTGSGAIILSILRELNHPCAAKGIDISSEALKVAQKNYNALLPSISLESTMEFIKGDRLGALKERQHLIVSNPPYIMKKRDRVNVHRQVDKFELHQGQ